MRAFVLSCVAIWLVLGGHRDLAASEWAVRYLLSDAPEVRRSFVCERDVICDWALLPPGTRDSIGIGTAADGSVLIGAFECRRCEVRRVRVVCRGRICFGDDHQPWSTLVLLGLASFAAIAAIISRRSERRDAAARDRLARALREAILKR